MQEVTRLAVDSFGESDSVLPLLARHALRMKECLTPTDIRWVRGALVDTFGCYHLGARQAPHSRLVDANEGSSGDALIYGTGRTMPPQQAALINGAAAHVMDFDDWEVPGNTHPSAVLVSAILAAGSGQPLSGSDFISAYVVGFEVIACLGRAVNLSHYERGWHSTGTLGALGAAASVSALWGLNAEATTNALSIAFSRAGGYTCQFGADTKMLQAGFAAEAGVVAAGLARAGLTGQHHILEHPKGFVELLAHGDHSRLQTMFDASNDASALSQYGLALKPYSCCGYAHRIIDCAVDVHAALQGDVSRVAAITIHVPETHGSILPFHQPQSMAEALFSLPFCAAVGLRDGAVMPSVYSQEAWNDPEIKALIARCHVRTRVLADPELTYDKDDPDRLVVELSDGRLIERAVAFPLGTPENPMSFDSIMRKCADNIDTSHDQRLSQLADWTEVSNVHAVLECFEPERRT